MIRRPPRSTRTDTLFPYTTLFRSDFQQVGISVERLGDILNTRTELPGSRMALPPIRGRVQFDNVTFRYRADSASVITDLDLDIAAGETIGIVGRSGSGKSTLTKLVQRLYQPERGRVLIDGHEDRKSTR